MDGLIMIIWGVFLPLPLKAGTLSRGNHDIRFAVDDKLKIFGDEEELRSAQLTSIRVFSGV